MFAGDLLDSRKGKLKPYPNMNYDRAELMKSIKSISDIPFKIICPAHGVPVERKNIYLQY